MNLTDLQVELRELQRVTDERIDALHVEIENMKPKDGPKLDIDFARITEVASRKPLLREDLRDAQSVAQKSFFAALAYLALLDGEGLEDKLYYLCRLAAGCGYTVSAEELCQQGLAYVAQDLERLGPDIGRLKHLLLVEALVVANLAGPASREALGALATLADSLGLEDHDLRARGQEALAILRADKAALEKIASWNSRERWQVGDVIKFGDYPQGANGEVEPIEWQVLRRDNEGLLVISKYALDYQPYNEDLVDITWSQCTLRRWLNSEFINEAFSESERAQITQRHLSNPNSKWNNVPGGPATDDKIFCLSHDEALNLFANDGQRQCYPTAYAKSQNAWTDDNGFCCWWLRSPGISAYDAAGVHSDGDIICIRVNFGNDAVRPAFFIAL